MEQQQVIEEIVDVEAGLVNGANNGVAILVTQSANQLHNLPCRI